MKRIAASIFISSDHSIPIIDVRSPNEYRKGHISGALNIPIFSDEERHEIGIIYKNLGKETAVEKGLAFVGPKIKKLAQSAKDLASGKSRKVYCWRGGMRSEKTAWLFELLGMECDVLEGGYKAYRNLQIADFKRIKKLNVLHGSTGCGKTDILHELYKSGQQIIDLEGLARHKGSAFGHIGMPEQPTTQQFQNEIHNLLANLNTEQPIWIEGESLRIGQVNLPDALWDRMKTGNVVEIKVNRENRLKRLVAEYGSCPKTELTTSIRNLKNQISSEKIKSILYFIELDNFTKAADMLLDYYDRTYEFTRKRFRENSIFIITSVSGDAMVNAQKLLDKFQKAEHTINDY